MKKAVYDIKGRCLCGAVSYSANGVPPYVIECHCSQCRRQSGHRYAFVDGRISQSAIHGEDKVSWYSATRDGKRGFCSICGSTLFWKSDTDDFLAFTAASVDEPNELFMTHHAFASSKGCYYEITDDLPRRDDEVKPFTAMPG